MFCKHCGAQIKEGALFCPSCGARVAPVKSMDEPEKIFYAGSTAGETKYENVKTESDHPEKQNSHKDNGYKQNAGGNGGYKVPKMEPFAFNADGVPVDYRNLLTFILLTIFTFGIYYFYTIYRLTKFTNNDPLKVNRDPVGELLLSIFFWPYQTYWHYETARRLNDMYLIRYGKENDISVAALVLSLAGENTGMGLISIVMIQNLINKIVGGYTGHNENSTGYGHCDSCGANDFADDLEYCPHCGTPYKKPVTRRLWFQILMLVIAVLVVVIIAGSIATHHVTNEIQNAAAMDMEDFLYNNLRYF